ncbi:MAG: DivIVA domain-containing protein [Acidimicrobiales bacterium]
MPPPPGPGGGLRLDDLRHPHLGGRVWGYDREEVDDLLALTVATIERLQRRRQRDAAVIQALTRDAEAAQARAGDVEHRVVAASSAVDVAEDAASQWQRRAREAEQRAADAEERASQLQRETEAVPVPDDEHLPQTLPLAQRAARALLREARASAASIVADAEERARTIEVGDDDRSGPVL